MATTRTVGIPRKLSDQILKGGRGVSSRLKHLVIRELDGTRPIAPPPQDDLVYVSVQIDAAMADAIAAARPRLPQGPDWSDAQVIAALAIAQGSEPAPHRVPTAPDLSVAVLHSLRALTARPEQIALAELVDQAIHHHRIAMLEAATGSGKGLVIAAAAIAAASNGQRVVIAAPTHQINRQTHLHLSRDLADQLPDDSRIALLYGRSAFVSRTALAEALDDDTSLDQATRERANHWLGEQDRAFRIGQRTGIYLLESLLQTCPTLPREDLILRSYDHDDASTCYQHQFASARTADILLMTHAMLATLTRRTRIEARRALKSTADQLTLWRDYNALLADECTGTIGRFNVLLIDEAHVFEQSVAGAMSELISLRSLGRKCRQLAAAVPAGPAKGSAITDSIASLSTLDEALQLATAHPEQRQQVHGELTLLESRLQALLKLFGNDGGKKKAAALDAQQRGMLDDVRRQVAAITFCINHPKGQLVHLRHSPDRRYPQLTIGPRSVLRDLDFLWQQVDAAALFSATLYTETASGVPSCAAITSRLSIDPVRVLSHMPVLPPWLTRSVTLHLPAADNTAWLPPPHDADDKIRSAYFTAVAAAVCAFCADASGGSLVLCTSHEAVQRLSAGWTGDPSRLVVHSRDTPFALTLRQFVRLAIDGVRPVWFATGQAWTGLDVYAGLPEDVAMPAPGDDDLLTHLVIPRLPFDLNTTSTELARRQYQGNQEWLSIVHECQLLLRQGIGRLIRRQNLSGRHLAVLDPRGASPSFRGMSSIRSIWNRYPQHQVLPDPTAPITTPTPPPAVPSTVRRIVFD